MKNKGNAKAQYSQAAIFQAFIELLGERVFQEITIQDIVQQAQVSRKTFYRNFDSKLDILSIGINQICQEYQDNLEKSTNLEFSTIAYWVFKTLEPHTPFIQVLVQNKLNYLLIDPLYEQVVALYRTKKSAFLQKYGERTVLHSLLFTFGGFEKLLEKWLEAAHPMTPKEAQKEFHQMLLLFIDSFAIEKEGIST